MGKPLAELRQQPDRAEKNLARRAYRLCLAQNLLAEMQSLNNELLKLTAGLERDEEGPKKPGRVGSPEVARLQEVRARMVELDAQIDDESGELTIQAIDDGAWDIWVSEHPARQEKGDPAGAVRDMEVAGGYCNANDLMEAESLLRFVVAWDGNALAEGDWEFIYANTSRGDKKELAKLVVTMQETAVNLPFLQRAWRAGLTNEPA